MRKAPISVIGTRSDRSGPDSWLEIEKVATAELSSEDPQHPFEQALRADTADGWKASDRGPQLIRLRFDIPQSIKRIHLQFQEGQVDRSQEIALFATSSGSPRKQLVRQQWAFSPGGSTTELEDYYFDLKDVTVLELEIDPGRHDKQVFASLQCIRIG
ncbi:hypothetical protein [Terracidiphilus sp.]|uniref:hypothetical protein n=1 Tax=Terracidiphilus sp. TaxID=1964191 RepID=UPI003C24A72A